MSKHILSNFHLEGEALQSNFRLRAREIPIGEFNLFSNTFYLIFPHKSNIFFAQRKEQYSSFLIYQQTTLKYYKSIIRTPYAKISVSEIMWYIVEFISLTNLKINLYELK